MKWEEIVLRFEWLSRTISISSSDKYSGWPTEAIRRALVELKYCFDEAMIDEWYDNLEGDEDDYFESLQEYVASNSKAFQHAWAQRLDKLIDDMLDKKRDENGKF